MVNAILVGLNGPRRSHGKRGTKSDRKFHQNQKFSCLLRSDRYGDGSSSLILDFIGIRHVGDAALYRDLIASRRGGSVIGHIHWRGPDWNLPLQGSIRALGIGKRLGALVLRLPYNAPIHRAIIGWIIYWKSGRRLCRDREGRVNRQRRRCRRQLYM